MQQDEVTDRRAHLTSRPEQSTRAKQARGVFAITRVDSKMNAREES